jgi:peptidoglycan-associated lipoprotein
MPLSRILNDQLTPGSVDLFNLNFDPNRTASAATPALPTCCAGSGCLSDAPPAMPTATLEANPNVIQQSQPTELTWLTTNASGIMIEGVGDVSASGSRSVIPSNSMTYTLVAKGPGGAQEATARVTVNPLAKVTNPATEDDFAKNVKDIFFDYDKSDVRPDQHPAAENDATFLIQHPGIKVLIEGHCDDRGLEEYNLALGDSRANSVKNASIAQR